MVLGVLLLALTFSTTLGILWGRKVPNSVHQQWVVGGVDLLDRTGSDFSGKDLMVFRYPLLMVSSILWA
jgi:hypothetical protein